MPRAYHGAGVAGTCGALGASVSENGAPPPRATVSRSHAIDLFAMTAVVYPPNSPAVLATYVPAAAWYASGPTAAPPAKSENVALR